MADDTSDLQELVRQARIQGHAAPVGRRRAKMGTPIDTSPSASGPHTADTTGRGKTVVEIGPVTTTRPEDEPVPYAAISPDAVVPDPIGPAPANSPGPHDSTTANEAPIQAVAARPARARGIWLNGLFAAVAVIAAGVALTAPSLSRLIAQPAPAIIPAEWRDSWSRVTQVVTPDNQAERDIAALMPRISGLEADVLRLRLEIRQLDRRLIEAGATWREQTHDIATVMRTTEAAGQRIDRIEAAGLALAERVRAAALLAAVTRLRRDIDAGAPLNDAVALMDLNGPYPATVIHAIETLRRTAGGVTTMRDLAIEYESLDLAIAASLGQDGSGWSRLRALFGGADDPRLSFLQRVRQMAAEGRMAEAATLLAHSPWQEQASQWIGRVNERTAASRAAHAISAYAMIQTQDGTQTQAGPEIPRLQSTAPEIPAAGAARRTPHAEPTRATLLQSETR